MVVAEGVELFLKGAADLRIRDEDVRILQTGDVECLRRRGTDDGIVRRLAADGGEGRVGIAGVGEVFMDFIRDDLHAVAQADLCISRKLFLRPDASGGIVRRAEERELHAAFDDLLFHVIEIDLIVAFFQDEAAVHEAAAILLDGGKEGIVDRLVKQDAVPRLRQCFDGDIDGRHDARGLDEPFRLDGPVEIGLLPGSECFEVGAACFRVAEDAMVYAGMKRTDDGLGHAEIHVRHPEGKDISRFAALHGEIVLEAAGASPVNDGIKVKYMHRKVLLSRAGLAS